MNDDQWDDDLKAKIQEAYNPPSEVPSEEMWAAISGQLPRAGELKQGAQLSAWTRRAPWMAAAAILVLSLGYGLGRWTAPTPDAGPRVAVTPTDTSGSDPSNNATPGATPENATPDGAVQPNAIPANTIPENATPESSPGATNPRAPNPRGPSGDPDNQPIRGGRTLYRFAAAQHLAVSSTFLGRLQDDVRGGSVPADAGDWARNLLTETRLILDSPAVEETDLRTLLEDLELLLLQISHASGAQKLGQTDLERIEFQQLNRGLDGNDLRSRIQRLVPPMLSASDL